MRGGSKDYEIKEVAKITRLSVLGAIGSVRFPVCQRIQLSAPDVSTWRSARWATFPRF